MRCEVFLLNDEKKNKINQIDSRFINDNTFNRNKSLLTSYHRKNSFDLKRVLLDVHNVFSQIQYDNNP